MRWKILGVSRERVYVTMYQTVQVLPLLLAKSYLNDKGGYHPPLTYL